MNDYEKIKEMLLYNQTKEVITQGAAAVPVLIRILKDNDEYARWPAAEALGDIAEKGGDCSAAVPALVEALRVESGNVRSEVAWALCRIAEKGGDCSSAISALSDALKDEYDRVRGSAAAALGKIAEKGGDCSSAVPALIEALKDEDEEGVVGSEAAGALGEIGDASAVPALIDALKDEKVRGSAAWALGNLAKKGRACSSAVPALIDVLKDADNGTRQNAAWALGNVGDASAVSALIDSLKDRMGRVRAGASIALAKIAEKTEIDLEKVKTTLKELVESVRKEGDPVKLRNVEAEAAGSLIRISNAAAKFRAGRNMDGIALEGTFKPPSGKKMYRKGARRAVA